MPSEHTDGLGCRGPASSSTNSTERLPCRQAARLLDGEPCRFFGAGHIIGTYRMGADPKSSVVNADQRSWGHENLWLVGSGVFPTEAAANPTLTIVALTLKAAEAILKALA